MPNPNLRLTLGTATLGMAYGVANPPSMLDTDMALSILDRAWDAGITSLDTAPAYGAAENRIGAWSRMRGVSPTLTTKLPSLSGIADDEIGDAITSHLERSLLALGTDCADYYLTHDASDYLRPAVRRHMSSLADQGRIGAYGPSLYLADEVFAALETAPPGAIQLPLSVLDQRMVSSGALSACQQSNVTVFARSVMLQGLILLPPDKVPPEMQPCAGAISALQELAGEMGTTPASLSLRFVRDIPQVASTIIGVYSHVQLEELVVAAAEPAIEAEGIYSIQEIVRSVPESLLDPRSWQG